MNEKAQKGPKRSEEEKGESLRHLEERVATLDRLRNGEGSLRRIEELEREIRALRAGLLEEMTAYEKVQLARHADRPYFVDYARMLFEDFEEIHGDRAFGDDPAIVAGFAFLSGRPVCLVGQQKGRDTRQKLHRNFGMPKPEGYRKALRVMKLAEKFHRPVLTFIDTPGAYPGIDAEERGQAEAIAFNLREMASLRVPVIATVTGEGGSGGALAIGVADRVNMLQFSIYSVIAPESCSAILWRDQRHAAEAAEALKLTPEHLSRLGLIDEVVPEPSGGAHHDADAMAVLLAAVLERQLGELDKIPLDTLVEERYQKFRGMGAFTG
jgi:acetyl-CoA carboxylase carboxyl transferase subunit alpha